MARFWQQQTASVATVRRGQRLPCVGFPVDPTQEVAEPISEAGGASGKTYLRKGKTPHGSMRTEEKSEINYSTNTKVR